MIVSTSTKAHHDDFESLLSDCKDTLCSIADTNTPYLLSRKGTKFEDDLYEQMTNHAKGTLFDGNIEKYSGQRFPDIVGWINKNQGYGVEVKTSIQNHWRTTGNSIFEGTRIDNIDRIYLFFGRLVEPIEFRYRKYEECLYDVAITHSPRYLIDMEIDTKNTIFSKTGVPYDEIRVLDNPFNPIKEYYKREVLKKGDDLWWVDKVDSNTSSIAIRAWNNLSHKEQENLKCEAMILFPEIFSKRQDKFNQMATWLIMSHSVVNPSLRDAFTGGGQRDVTVNHVSYRVPRIFEHLEKLVVDIAYKINQLDRETLEHYWGRPISENRFEQWKLLVKNNSEFMVSDSGVDISKMITERLSKWQGMQK